MRTPLIDRCTSLLGHARSVLRRHSLKRKPTKQRPMGMELLDLELFRNDIGG